MGGNTVWYSIHHPDYPHCAQGQTLIGGLPDRMAEEVADRLMRELRYVTGLDGEIRTWVD